MNVAICDDNVRDRTEICALLRAHFERNAYTGELHTFGSGEALLAAATTQTFDAVFLDVYMGGMNGMDTAAKLREIDPNFALVFITVSRDHAMDSYARRAVAYVPKPIHRADIENAFLQCRHVFLKNARFIEVVSYRQKIKVPLAKIIYIETYGRETHFHTTTGTIKSTAPLLLEELDSALGTAFLRCHRSYIVNLNYVAAVQVEDFYMRNGTLVPLRQRGRTDLRDAYANFVSDRLFEVI